jgi:hypothetical protein
MDVLLVVAALVVAAPIAAAMLVTLASHREDFSRSLAGRPPGPLAAAARALLCLRIGGRAYPRRPPGRSRGHEEKFNRSDDRTLTLPRS